MVVGPIGVADFLLETLEENDSLSKASSPLC